MTGALYLGTSGFSYPTWKPGFYPAGTPQREFLRFVRGALQLGRAEHDRLPAARRRTQFRRWAEETPEGFRFAVKMPHPNRLGAFTDRVQALGEQARPGADRRPAGPRRRVPGASARLARPGAPLGVRLPPRVLGGRRDRPRQRSSTPSKAPRRSGTCACGNRRTTRPACAVGRPGSAPLLADGIEVYAYFKHEDEPTAPGYALRLLELLAANNAD